MKSITTRNLHEQVMEILGRRIISGRLRPGELLPREEVLAEEMAVSRTALREALKILGAKGLIETRQKTGSRVRAAHLWNQLDADVLAWRCALMPTEDFVEKLVEMREIIEPAAAAAAAQRRDEAQLQRIFAAYTAMDAAQTQDEWAKADLAFHENVLNATNNELLSSLFAVIDTALGAYFTLSAQQAAEHFKYSLPQHFAVYEAIRRQRPQLAHKAMSGMIADSRANISRMWQRRRA